MITSTYNGAEFHRSIPWSALHQRFAPRCMLATNVKACHLALPLSPFLLKPNNIAEGWSGHCFFYAAILSASGENNFPMKPCIFFNCGQIVIHESCELITKRHGVKWSEICAPTHGLIASVEWNGALTRKRRSAFTPLHTTPLINQ